jgi:diacylglycerol O-acyltransferase
MSDRSNLRVERPDTPAHVGGLCLVEAQGLLDGDGELDLAKIRRRLGLRLARVPELRQVVYQSCLFGGAPIWVDDPDFRIERHVNAVRVPVPGDERTLLDATAEFMRPLLDRSKPLWELWLLTGLAGPAWECCSSCTT